MRKNNRVRARRTSRPGKVLIPLVMAILVGGVGAFAALVGLGQIKVDMSALGSIFGQSGSTETQQAAAPRSADLGEGEVWLYMNTRAIKPYEDIRREHFQDPTGGDPNQLFRARVRPEQLSDLNKLAAAARGDRPVNLIGRVAREAIPEVTVINATMLFAPGTLPGPAAGVPSGMSMLTIDANQMSGIDALLIRDRFDILASFPPEPALNTRQSEFRGPGVDKRVTRDSLTPISGPSNPTVRVIAEGSMVVQPVHEPTGQRSGSRQFSFATTPAAIAAYQEAIASGATLYAMARSNQPSADRSGPLTGIPSITEFEASRPSGVETIVGEDKRLVVFPNR